MGTVLWILSLSLDSWLSSCFPNYSHTLIWLSWGDSSVPSIGILGVPEDIYAILGITRWLTSYMLCRLPHLTLWEQTSSCVLGRLSPVVTRFGSLHGDPGKMRGFLVTLSNSKHLQSKHLLVTLVLRIFPFRPLAFIFNFWQMSSKCKYGICHPSKVAREPWPICGGPEPPHAPCQPCSQVVSHSALCFSWATLAVLLTGSWFLASCPARQPQTNSASCYVMDGRHSREGWQFGSIPGQSLLKPTKCAWIYNVALSGGNFKIFKSILRIVNFRIFHNV